MIGIGAVNILDTYLSPEKYRGTELRYISHTLRERRDSRWSRLIVHQGNMSYSDNRSGNGGEIAGAYTFSYGVHYNWNFFDGSLNVKAGAQADVNVGFSTTRATATTCAGTPVAQHIAVGSRHIPLSPVAAQLLAAL